MATSSQIDKVTKITGYLAQQQFPRNVADIAANTGINRLTVSSILNHVAFRDAFGNDGRSYYLIGSNAQQPVASVPIASTPDKQPAVTVEAVKPKYYASKPNAQLRKAIMAGNAAIGASEDFKAWAAETKPKSEIHAMKLIIGQMIGMLEEQEAYAAKQGK